MHIKVSGYEGVDWIHLAQDRDQQRALVTMVMNLIDPYKTENLMSTRFTLNVSRMTPLHEVRCIHKPRYVSMDNW
jgi:hypothetical protein